MKPIASIIVPLFSKKLNVLYYKELIYYEACNPMPLWYNAEEAGLLRVRSFSFVEANTIQRTRR